MKLQLIAAIIAALIFASPAQAETTICTEIPALPFTITVQGVYCLKKNLNVNLTSGNAITINAGNVTIDFNGFRVNNQAAASAAASTIGLFAVDRKNITLRNGFVRGFGIGIGIDLDTPNASGGHLIEQMKIAESVGGGIFVLGSNSQIRNNFVVNTADGTDAGFISAIVIVSDNSVISDNIVADVGGTGGNIGIRVNGSNRVRISGNRISGIDGSSEDAGIFIDQSDAVTVTGNRMQNDFGTGEFAILDNNSTNVSCIGNDYGGFSATPLQGCDLDVDNRKFYN